MTRLARLFIILAIASPSLASSSTAWAEPSKAEPSKAELEARKRLKQGKEAANRGDAEAARLAFQQAYSIFPIPDATFNLALMEMDGHQPVEALRHFREYLRDKRVTDAKDKAEAEQYVRELWPRTGHVRIKAPPATIVKVDGVLVKEEELADPIDVNPGRRVVEFRTTSKEQQTSVEAPAGKEVEVAFALDAAGDREPKTYHSTAKVVTVVGLGAAGVASIVASIAFAMAKSNAQDRVDERRTTYGPSGCGAAPVPGYCSEWQQAVDDVKSNQDRANLFMGLGIGAVVASGIVWFAWPKSTEQPATGAAIRFAPLVGPNQWAFTATGRF